MRVAVNYYGCEPFEVEAHSKARLDELIKAECHSAIIALRTFIDYCKLEPAQYRILGGLLDE